MRSILTAGAAALILVSGPALAQSTIDTTTTRSTTVAPILAPPPETLSTTRTTRSVDAYGNRVDSQSTTYRNGMGVAEDRQTTTRTVTVPPPVTTTTTTTRSVTDQ